MLSYTNGVVIALDATPLSIGTGGVSRYTLELTRALALRYSDDQYWLISDQAIPIPPGLPENVKFRAGPQNAAEKRWWLWGIRQEMSRIGAQAFHGTDFSVPYTRSVRNVMTIHDLSPWRYPEWQPGAG